MFTGIGMSVTMGIIMLVYALSFWYGYQLIVDGVLTAGRVLTVYFSIIIGAMAIGQAAPSLTAFADGMPMVTCILWLLTSVPRLFPNHKLFSRTISKWFIATRVVWSLSS